MRALAILSCLLPLVVACEPSDGETTTEAPRRKKKRRKRKTSASTGKRPPPVPAGPHPGLRDPTQAELKAPATFEARFDTTKGPITFRCERAWSPLGVDRFYSLVKIGFFRDIAVYRVVPGFVAQFGIHGDPAVSKLWKSANLAAEPVAQSNTRGMLSYAMAGKPTTRSTQLFINLDNNARLDTLGFGPICQVTEGMDVVDRFYAGHAGKVGSRQPEIQTGGNAFLRKVFPGLDYIVSAAVIGER